MRVNAHCTPLLCVLFSTEDYTVQLVSAGQDISLNNSVSTQTFEVVVGVRGIIAATVFDKITWPSNPGLPSSTGSGRSFYPIGNALVSPGLRSRAAGPASTTASRLGLCGKQHIPSGTATPPTYTAAYTAAYMVPACSTILILYRICAWVKLICEHCASASKQCLDCCCFCCLLHVWRCAG
jgi:hypothetical protein